MEGQLFLSITMFPNKLFYKASTSALMGTTDQLVTQSELCLSTG